MVFLLLPLLDTNDASVPRLDLCLLPLSVALACTAQHPATIKVMITKILGCTHCVSRHIRFTVPLPFYLSIHKWWI